MHGGYGGCGGACCPSCSRLSRLGVAQRRRVSPVLSPRVLTCRNRTLCLAPLRCCLLLSLNASLLLPARGAPHRRRLLTPLLLLDRRPTAPRTARGRAMGGGTGGALGVGREYWHHAGQRWHADHLSHGRCSLGASQGKLKEIRSGKKVEGEVTSCSASLLLATARRRSWPPARCCFLPHVPCLRATALQTWRAAARVRRAQPPLPHESRSRPWPAGPRLSQEAPPARSRPCASHAAAPLPPPAGQRPAARGATAAGSVRGEGGGGPPAAGSGPGR